MAVNFGLLQPVQPVSAFFQGQQDVQRQAEQNMLRQSQMENMAAQRAERLAMMQDRQAMTQERTAKAAQAAKRQEFLTNLGTKMAEGGHKLDRPTLGQVLQFGMQTGEDSLIKLATEGMRALDEEEVYAREATRFGLPGAAAPAAGEPANALAAPAPAGITRETVQNMMASPSARIREQAKALAQTLPKGEATPSDVATMKALGFPLTAAGYAQFRDAQRQERLLSPEEEAQRVRIARESRPLPQPRPEPAPRTQQVTMSDGTLGVMNMDTGQVTPASLGGTPVKGKPSAFAEKTAVQRKQLGLDLDRAITELTDAAKKGGLIDQSTGSGAGRLVDVGAGFFGQATPGAIAAGKLAPIADMVLKMVPRFEGPQSDKDTRSYKEAAGQLADSSLPNAIRKQAGLEIVRLMKERKNQFVTPEMAVEGAGAGGAAPAAAGGGNFPPPPAAAIDALRRGQGTDAQFDAIFGPGAAARARGR
jgi:hypothetical protein